MSQEDLVQSKDEITIYSKGKVSSKCLADNFVILKKAFPKLGLGWYDILERMLNDEQFSDKKFSDAVYNLIKTCQYPEPTVANILSYDRKIKIFTYEDLLRITCDYGIELRRKTLNNYSPIKIDNETRYVLNEHKKYFQT